MNMLYIAGLVLLAVMLVVQFLTRKIDNSFVTRLISGVILLILALLFITLGGRLLFAVSLLLSEIAVFELYRACGLHENGFSLLEIAGFAGIAVYYLSIVLASGHFQIHGLLFSLVILLSVYVFTFPRFHAEQVMAAVFASLYAGVMLSFVYQTRMLTDGRFHVWLIFLCAWGCDTCAYCAGRLFGKHKMSPVLSPKKTVEGAIGGVAGAVVLGLVFALCTHGPALIYMLICGVGALISMVGDLAASAIKRNVGIKDYGRLIPGHGGVLDRFDSVIFTAPVIYVLAVVLI